MAYRIPDNIIEMYKNDPEKWEIKKDIERTNFHNELELLGIQTEKKCCEIFERLWKNAESSWIFPNESDYNKIYNQLRNEIGTQPHDTELNELTIDDVLADNATQDMQSTKR